MTLSAKWTVVSFFALTSVAAGSFAFAGCTVTSGNPVDTDSGFPITTPTPEAGDTDAADGAAAACPGNTQQKSVFINATCQAKLDSVCCTELTTCFNLTPVGMDDAGTTPQDCNGYTNCIDICTKKADGVTPETDPMKVSLCDDDCDSLSSQNVIDAYKAIADCATAKASGECQ
jgi:hypothetical protein